MTHTYLPSHTLGKAIAAQRQQLVDAIARAQAKGMSVTELSQLFHWPDDSILYLLALLVTDGVLVAVDLVDETTIRVRYFVPAFAPEPAPAMAPDQEVDRESE